MIKVAIVEDDKNAQAVITDYLNKYPCSFSTKVFSSAVEFLAGFAPVYDIVFKDIDMPYLDGMSAARKLREYDSEVCLIFVTNMAKLAVKGYEVSAFEFIVTPVDYPVFKLKLDRAMKHLSTKVSRSIMVSSGETRFKIRVADIKYVEIIRHKIIYHTVGQDIVSYGTLKNVEEALMDPLFVRCNSCYLVNLRFVSAINGDSVIVGSDSLLMSSRRKSGFEKALADYLCGT